MADPTIPTREELARALGDDPRLIQAFEDLFYLIPDELNDAVLELQGAVGSYIAPSLNQLQALVAGLFPKELQWDASKGASITLPDNTRLVVDMSAGDVNVVLPDSMTLGASISRIGGDDNTLSITGTINGETDWEICFEGSTACVFFDKANEQYRFGGR